MIQEWVFPGCPVLLGIKETKLGRVTKVVTKRLLLGVVDISEVPGCHLRVLLVKKLLKISVFLMNSWPVFLILTFYEVYEMAMLSKVRKPDNFESRDSLRLSFTNIRALC